MQVVKMDIESKYLQFLPGIFQTGMDDKSPGFLLRFLKAFENILSVFSCIEVKDAAGMAERLRDTSDPFTVYIRKKFSSETRKLIDEYDGSDARSEILRDSLSNELNELLLCESLYDEEGFSGIQLSPGTTSLLEQYPKNEDLRRLNCMLLKDAFTYELERGFEETLDTIHDYFDADRTPPSFLPWLAGWVALTLKEEKGWDEAKKRRLISQIVPLYKKRGTREGLEEYLKIYVGEGVRIIDELGPFQIGVHSKIGLDTVIGGLPAYFFIVDITLPVPDPLMINEKRKAIEELIEMEKPAHTYYRINITVPTMRIGYYSRIGVDTLLWD
jgi:phage tail-like protein